MNITVDAIFNWLNFIARIGIVIFLIRRYVVARVQKSILLERQDLQQLEKQHEQYGQACSVIEKNMKDQERVFEDLQKKFQIWQQQIALQHAMYQQHCAEHQHKLKQQCEKKQYLVQRRKILEAELPIFLSQCRVNLQEKFKKDTDRAVAYSDKIIEQISGK